MEAAAGRGWCGRYCGRSLPPRLDLTLELADRFECLPMLLLLEMELSRLWEEEEDSSSSPRASSSSSYIIPRDLPEMRD